MENITICLLQYNNYYNRLVKVENHLGGYVSNIVNVTENVNFNPNDHISAEHIINVDDDLEFDYCIIINSSNEIVSRWFVLEKERVRGGQWKVSLYRDTVADYYNLILEAPCFIEKAYLPFDDKLIFNSEDIAVNQIKMAETQLKDDSGCAWLVGYYAKNAAQLQGTVNINNDNAIGIGTSIEDWEYYSYSNLSTTPKLFYGTPENINYKAAVLELNSNTITPQTLTFVINSTSGSVAKNYGDLLAGLNGLRESYTLTANQLAASVASYGISNLNPYPSMSAYAGLQVDADYFNDFIKYKDKIIKDLNGRFYSVSIVSKDIKTTTDAVAADSDLSLRLTTILKNTGRVQGNPDSKSFKVVYTAQTYSIVLTELENLETTYNITNNRLKTEDAPYDIFAIPYGEVEVTKVNDSSFALTTSREIGMATAMSIQLQEGIQIYDIQILPYCPVSELLIANGKLEVVDDRQYSFIVDNNSQTNVGIIFNVPRSSFSVNIQHTISGGETAMEKKLINQCDLYRLVSPNYNGSFDFNPAKNGGVEFFNVDCTYKPYSPYIHVNPNFKELYGQDYNDPRGLICGGDFSLASISDSWINYQIQNKTFQETFDRQIKTLELQNKYQKEADIWGAIGGTAQGTVSGAFLGGSVGGPWGAAAGAMVGGTASLIGGIRDIQINEALRKDAMDLSKDQFSYQLQSIQALPYSLTKVSSLNLNNKIFPTLEYYTCTDREREAVKNKIIYNGMTVMAIGKLSNYIGYNYEDEPAYIKGKLIRLTAINDDYHLVNTISRELNLGLYFGG